MVQAQILMMHILQSIPTGCATQQTCPILMNGYDLQGATARKALETLEALFRPYAYQHVLTKELQAVQEYGVQYCNVLKQCAADFTFQALHDTPFGKSQRTHQF
jgi:hypothetical protein